MLMAEHTSSKDQQDRRNEVRWIAIRLKSHAKRLGIALILISQLTMPRDDAGVSKEPGKYNLREAGDLTNAAEAVILAWREDESDEARINVKVAQGKSGSVGMRWEVERCPESHEMVELSEPAYRPRAKAPARGFR